MPYSLPRSDHLAADSVQQPSKFGRWIEAKGRLIRGLSGMSSSSRHPEWSKPAGRAQSDGEKLDLKLPREHFDEIQFLGNLLEVTPGPVPEGVGRDAERGANGTLTF